MQINLDTIAALLRDQHGIANAYVEQTGGGVATIYAGPTRHEEGWGKRYAAVAGPGSFSYTGPSMADSSDFYVGPDDQGESEPLTVADIGATTEAQIAALIAAQAQQADPTQPLGFDDVEALGLDGTGRGGHQRRAR